MSAPANRNHGEADLSDAESPPAVAFPRHGANGRGVATRYDRTAVRELPYGGRIVTANAGDHPLVVQLLTHARQTAVADDFQSRLDEPGYRPSNRLLVHREKELLAQAQCKSRAQLERPGLDRLIERFSKLLEDKIDEHPEITIQDLARTDLIRVAGKVRKSIRKLGDADSDDALHLLRIRFKKLRYALELYAVVISDELRVATRQARAIQDLLGTHQDACVAVAHGQRLAAQLPLIPQNREVLVTLGRLQSERERQATKIRRSFLSGSTAAGNAGREFSRLLKRALKTL